MTVCDTIKIAFYERSIGKLTLPVKEKRNVSKSYCVIFTEVRADNIDRIRGYFLWNTNAGNDGVPAFDDFCLEVSAGST